MAPDPIQRLDLEFVEGGPSPVVYARGEVDASTVPVLALLLQELADRKAERVVVDLDGVSFFDSTSLGALVAAARLLEEHDGRLVLQAVPLRVARVLQVTGTGGHFELTD